MEYENAGKTLIEYMRCQICGFHSTDKVVGCSIGHLVCEMCANKLSAPVCPTCKDDLTEHEALSRMMRVAEYKFACRNLEDGCTVSLKALELKDHLLRCLFRPMDCGMSKRCRKSAAQHQLSEVRRHWLTYHRVDTGTRNSQPPTQYRLVNEREVTEYVFPYIEFGFDEDTQYKYFKFGSNEYLFAVGCPDEEIVFWMTNLNLNNGVDMATYTAELGPSSSVTRVSFRNLPIVSIREHGYEEATGIGCHGSVQTALLTTKYAPTTASTYLEDIHIRIQMFQNS